VLSPPQLGELLEHTDLVVVALDRTQRILWANQAVPRTLGWDPAELVGELADVLLAPAGATPAGAGDRWPRGPVPAGSTGTTSTALRHRDGTSRYLRLSTTGLSDGSVVVGWDVTDEHHEVLCMQRSERLLREAERLAGVGSFEWDAETGRHHWSEQMHRLARLPEGIEPSDELVLSLVHPHDRARFDAAIASAVATLEPLELEVQALLTDGSERRMKVLGHTVPGPEHLRLVGVAQDVTDLAVAPPDLHHRQRMESIGRLAGGVAHDFNNLLMAIGGFTELAQQALTADPEQASTHLARVAAATERAAGLTRQLLLFARHESGEPIPVDLSGTARDVVELLEASVPADVEVRLDLPATGPVVIADPSQVQQVIMNLVLNAVAAVGERGTVRMAVIALAAAADTVDRALLVVADDGVGMSDDVRQRALEPFFTTKGEGGTGLGLATVYGVVTGLGGTIDILSAPGSGTSVVVELPAGEGAVAASDDLGAPPAGSGQRILVVEDDPVLCDLVSRILTVGGYDVTSALDGLVACEVATRVDRLDAVVCDLMLPGCTGDRVIEVARQVRPGLPAVLMSGSDPEVRLGDGHSVLTKPVAPADLLRSVAAVLAGAPGATVGSDVGADARPAQMAT
jgi:two-component system, cell cycle sensor histidine kinase and response regulator CckA